MRNNRKNLISKIPDDSPLSAYISGYVHKVGCISSSKKNHGTRCKRMKKTSPNVMSTISSRRRVPRLIGGKDSSSTKKQASILRKHCWNDSSYKRKAKKSLSSEARKKHVLGMVEVHKFRKKRRKQGTKKGGNQHDEASRFQRRTRYLLIKLKLEQNLIDAYSAEGWRGQSREKIKPEKELQRAEKQIIHCKLGIRDVICELDKLSSDGRIEGSVIDPDGRVSHEHIFCATCKMRDAFPDNDIILCDGACNRAFHQKCLNPPLDTANIPPDGEGWFCKHCYCKMEILGAINAHLYTEFSVNTNWQDIFIDAVNTPSRGNESMSPENAWPSDDSEDEDYDPQSNNKNCLNDSGESDCISSGNSCWSDEVSSLCEEAAESDADEETTSFRHMDGHHGMIAYSDSPTEVHGNDVFECETMNYRRQRKTVDYQKLYDEMFGKDLMERDQFSEDEDWGPGRKNKRVKGSEEKLIGQENSVINDVSKDSHQEISQLPVKKSVFRIPADVVKKLRQVFEENELPPRDVRESLSLELGIATKQVSKWFKNARYLALRTRKQGELSSESVKDKAHASEKGCKSTLGTKSYDTRLALSADNFSVTKNIKKNCLKRKPKAIMARSESCKRKADTITPNSFKELNAAQLTEKLGFPCQEQLVKRNLIEQLGTRCQEQPLKLIKPTCKTKLKDKLHAKVLPPAEPNFQRLSTLIQLERMCRLKNRVDDLRRRLRNFSFVSQPISDSHSKLPKVVLVPVADVRERACVQSLSF